MYGVQPKSTTKIGCKVEAGVVSGRMRYRIDSYIIFSRCVLTGYKFSLELRLYRGRVFQKWYGTSDDEILVEWL